VAANGGSDELLGRVRGICLAFPEASEGGGVGNPSWRIGEKIFAMRHDSHAGHWGIWCKAPPGAQRALVDGDRDRFFVPPYVGVHGWIGISLEVDQDWDLIADLIEESYRMTAPKRVVAALDASRG
jgi:predicted DNA-binding protein (MmcQ/YjbR family)